YDQANDARAALDGTQNISCAESLAALCARLEGERLVLLMLPAGAAGEDTIRDLVPLLSAGDTVVDGGNSYYRDSMRRALELSQRGLRYIDAGVSGGIHGRDQGYCLMLGGTPKSIEIFEPVAKLLAPHAENGWLHCGPSGAGHFAKMVHNGIEYGMMQALAEGLAKRLGWPLIEGDDYHPAANICKMAAGIPLTDEDRWPWLYTLNQRILEERNAVVTCSALKESYRRRLLAGIDDARIVYLHA